MTKELVACLNTTAFPYSLLDFRSKCVGDVYKTRQTPQLGDRKDQYALHWYKLEGENPTVGYHSGRSDTPRRKDDRRGTTQSPHAYPGLDMTNYFDYPYIYGI